MFDSRRTGGIAAEVAPADDQLRPRRLERGEERRDLGRVVLAVGVERHDRRRAAVERVPEAGPQRRALAGVRDLAQDGRAGRLGAGGRVVGRAVVDDDDRQVARGPPSTTGADARAFLVCRDEREDATRSRISSPAQYRVAA